MTENSRNGTGRDELAAELEIDPNDEQLIDAAETLRNLREHPPAEDAAARHVTAAATLAAELASAPPRGGRQRMTALARVAGVAAALMIATGGAAYAGVLPAEVGSAVSQITSSLGLPEPKVADAAQPPAVASDQSSDEEEPSPTATTTTDTTMVGHDDSAKDHPDRPDEKPVVHRIPPEVAAMLQSVADYRVAAREWRRCVIGDRLHEPEPPDIAACGDAPTPEAFGITDEALAELSEKAQMRIARLVEPITTRLTCIESHLGDRQAMRECISASNPEAKKSDPPRQDPDAKPRERRHGDELGGRDGSEAGRDGRDGSEAGREGRKSEDRPAERESPERKQLKDGGTRRHRR